MVVVVLGLYLSAHSVCWWPPIFSVLSKGYSCCDLSIETSYLRNDTFHFIAFITPLSVFLERRVTIQSNIILWQVVAFFQECRWNSICSLCEYLLKAYYLSFKWEAGHVFRFRSRSIPYATVSCALLDKSVPFYQYLVLLVSQIILS